LFIYSQVFWRNNTFHGIWLLPFISNHLNFPQLTSLCKWILSLDFHRRSLILIPNMPHKIFVSIINRRCTRSHANPRKPSAQQFPVTSMSYLLGWVLLKPVCATSTICSEDIFGCEGMLMLRIRQNIFRVIRRSPPTSKEGWQTWQKVNINFETFSPAHETVQIDVDGHAPQGISLQEIFVYSRYYLVIRI